jgi:hypothetical protein
MMIGNGLLGLLTLVIPLLIIGIVALRRAPWGLALFVALLAVGSGYLHTTGALKDIGRHVRTYVPAGILAERKPKEPEATTPAAAPETPAPTPPAAPPATTPAPEPSPAPPAPATNP